MKPKEEKTVNKKIKALIILPNDIQEEEKEKILGKYKNSFPLTEQEVDELSEEDKKRFSNVKNLVFLGGKEDTPKEVANLISKLIPSGKTVSIIVIWIPDDALTDEQKTKFISNLRGELEGEGIKVKSISHEKSNTKISDNDTKHQKANSFGEYNPVKGAPEANKAQTAPKEILPRDEPIEKDFNGPVLTTEQANAGKLLGEFAQESSAEVSASLQQPLGEELNEKPRKENPHNPSPNKNHETNLPVSELRKREYEQSRISIGPRREKTGHSKKEIKRTKKKRGND